MRQHHAPTAIPQAALGCLDARTLPILVTARLVKPSSSKTYGPGNTDSMEMLPKPQTLNPNSLTLPLDFSAEPGLFLRGSLWPHSIFGVIPVLFLLLLCLALQHLEILLPPAVGAVGHN